MDTSTKVNWLKLLQYTVLLGVILYVGRSLFVPLSFSLLISFVLYPVCRWLENKGLPRWAAIAICLSVLLLLFGGLAWLLVNQLMRLVEEWPNLLKWQKFLNENTHPEYDLYILKDNIGKPITLYNN